MVLRIMNLSHTVRHVHLVHRSFVASYLFDYNFPPPEALVESNLMNHIL